MATAEKIPLSRARIIAGAIHLVDDEGLGALSMRRLGAALGVEAMSLYNHVQNKGDVLDGMCDEIMSQMQLPEPEAPWPRRMRALLIEVRQVLMAHPGVLPLFGTRPPVTPAGFAPVEMLHRVSVEAGLGADRDLDAFLLLGSFLLGYLRIDEGRMRETEGDPSAPYERWTGSEHQPAVELGRSLVSRDWDAEFERCLDLVIGSLVALADLPTPS
jgi:TetR/AcrR family transcriptional regulator, tetracycline repressor protein